MTHLPWLQTGGLLNSLSRPTGLFAQSLGRHPNHGLADDMYLLRQSFGRHPSVSFVSPAFTADITVGAYTPTLTNVANLDASTAYECQYLKVGRTVTVSGKVDVDPTAPAASTQLGITLPIASNFGATEDCAGAAFASAIAGQGAAILGDATNDRAQMTWVAGDVTNQPMYFTFTYQVI